ncbi:MULTISPECIES: hypothetical protein [Paenibacillus]|jgi:hypothetical protein|uniref:hypothetical protein n=1 Tax=Paenibacillus TaxID=44249 RepID=UPI001D67F4AE|nr:MULTISPECIES: hypothetical protein [Paenibacillus]MBZ6453330.1 hypothetical protein [Paenibacillus polymyxa]
MIQLDNLALESWIDTHKIMDRTLEGFWVTFNNYMKECPEEISLFFDELNLENIKPSIDTIEYKTIFHSDYQIVDSHYSQQVISTLDIYYKKKRIGYYRMFFYTDGECFDDSLVTEWTGWYITLKLKALIELQQEIKNELVKNKIKEDEIEKIYNLIDKQISKIKVQIHK